MSSIATPPGADVKQAGRIASKAEENLFQYVLAPLASLKLALNQDQISSEVGSDQDQIAEGFRYRIGHGK